jgi:hypothetical protein
MADTYMASVRTSTPSGAVFVNDFCVRADNSGLDPLPDMTEIGGLIWSWLSPHYLFVISSSYTVQLLHVRKLYETPAEVADYAIGTAGSAVSGTGLPRELCRILSFRTGLAGRSYRGRVFLPCPRNTGELLSSDANQFDTSSSWWSAGHSFASDLLDGKDISYGPLSAYTGHLSLRVYSRKLAEDHDVTAILEPTAVHFLRSRTSIP